MEVHSGVASARGATVVTGVQRADCREHNVFSIPDTPRPAAQSAAPIFVCCHIRSFKSSNQALLMTKSLFFFFHFLLFINLFILKLQFSSVNLTIIKLYFMGFLQLLIPLYRSPLTYQVSDLGRHVLSPHLTQFFFFLPMAPFSLGFTEKQLISGLLFVFPHRVYDHVASWLLLVDVIHS